MASLWDSNILRHYSANHPLLHENLKRISISEVPVPIIVYAEQLRGRIDGLLKADPQRLLLAQQYLKDTQEMLSGFSILDLDESMITITENLKKQIKTHKRHADLIIAAQAIAGRRILVTRNTSHFHDLLPSAQLQNWIDERLG
jgi:predicted nucleic acid-binding protein